MCVKSLSTHCWVAILVIFLLVLIACGKKAEEQVVSTYPDGKKKETAIYQGAKPNQKMLKSLEYYQTGEKKKEYNYQDNLFHGPFTYWYKDGKIFCEGYIENKAINLGLVTGRETYFWPNGVKMLEAETVGGKLKPGTIPIYRDEKGIEYRDEERPVDLVNRTKELTDRWERGEL